MPADKILVESEERSTVLASDASREQTTLNRLADYLRDHFADALNLADLARMAGFSKYHFHRIFKARFGETPGNYLKRIRLEQAAYRLLPDHHARITDIAYECGFSSSQHFANSFKEHFGVTPGLVRDKFDWRTLLLKKFQVMESLHAKRHCLPAELKKEKIFIPLPSLKEDGQAGAAYQELEVVNFPSYRVACVRLLTVPGSEAMGQAMHKILQWSYAQKLFLRGTGQLIAAVEIVPDPDGRYTIDACVTIPEDMAIGEDETIQSRYLPGGPYGIYHGKFQTTEDLASSRDELIRNWWISSYFSRNQRPRYIIFYDGPAVDPSVPWLVDICLPVTTRQKHTHQSPKQQDPTKL